MAIPDMASDTKPKPQRMQSNERPHTEIISPRREPWLGGAFIRNQETERTLGQGI